MGDTLPHDPDMLLAEDGRLVDGSVLVTPLLELEPVVGEGNVVYTPNIRDTCRSGQIRFKDGDIYDRTDRARQFSVSAWEDLLRFGELSESHTDPKHEDREQ